MQKRYLLLFMMIAFCCLTGFSTHRLAKQAAKQQSNSNQNSNVVTVTQGDISEVVTAVGNITPVQEIEVRSPLTGTVYALYHDDGDYVKQGEPLLVIQPQPTPSDYATAKQQVAEDVVAQTSAAQDLSRYQFLLKNKAISPDDQDFATASKTYLTAKLTTQLDQQKLALMSQGEVQGAGGTLSNIIVAPISGYIMQRNVDLGGSVTGQSSAQAGDTLFTIANMNNLMFEGQVSEIDVAKIHKNMNAILSIAALPNTQITGDLSNISLQSVQAGASTASASTTSTSSPFNVGFDVWITHLNIPKNIHLLAGYSTTANITVKTVENALIIPESALQYDGDNTFVTIYQGEKNPPVKQYITVGITDGINAQVLKGLSKGQQIALPTANSDASL